MVVWLGVRADREVEVVREEDRKAAALRMRTMIFSFKSCR